MSDVNNDAVMRLLRLLGDRLERYLEGDDSALETLVESFEQEGFSADEIQAASAFLLRMVGGGRSEASVGGTPGKDAQRVLSPEERESLSPEAWGYLIDLKRRGSLSAEQYEQVLDLLVGSGVRPIGVDLAREVAMRVVLDVDDSGLPDYGYDEAERSH
jgi:uncharacterized protein Smg (DUF494 family)